MLPAHAILVLLSLLLGMLTSVVAWGFWQNHTQELNGFLPGARDEVLLGLLALAAFALGIFLTYALLILNF